MSTYVAFLRAINLGARRKFPKDALAAATGAAGFDGVATHINTGNVRLETRMRSVDRIATLLEEAYLAAAGFEVPTVVVSTADLRAIAADAEELARGFDGGPAGAGEPIGLQYVSFLKADPDPAGVAALEARATDTERVRVRGRAVHIALAGDYHSASLTNATVERHLGVATNRNLTVVRALVSKWC